MPSATTQHAQLSDALRQAIKGEVRFSDGDRALYSYDASIYRQVPIGVVLPEDAADVEAAVALCRQFDVPIFGRGCGTALAGQTCNVAVVIDFSKYMAGIVELAPERKQARVLPGTICDTLRFRAEDYGLTFAPDPATHDHCTLGGMIGNNSCGTHSLLGGKTVDNTERLEILKYDGRRMSVGKVPARRSRPWSVTSPQGSSRRRYGARRSTNIRRNRISRMTWPTRTIATTARSAVRADMKSGFTTPGDAPRGMPLHQRSVAVGTRRCSSGHPLMRSY